MPQNLSLLVTSAIFAITGFVITKYSYRPKSDNYRGKILGPGFILAALIAFYKVLEGYFGW
jgi:hypothetical protein